MMVVKYSRRWYKKIWFLNRTTLPNEEAILKTVTNTSISIGSNGMEYVNENILPNVYQKESMDDHWLLKVPAIRR